MYYMAQIGLLYWETSMRIYCLIKRVNLSMSVFMQMGFQQHVTCSTTDYGSLLDHVYSRRIDDFGVDVVDTYYSDHDRVFCFFK